MFFCQMDARRDVEQRLFTEVLRTTAVPRRHNRESWLSIDLWIDVTDALMPKLVDGLPSAI